ncbi:MAG: D-alanine--D-alanine ligase A [Chloroflexi bacterium HGW-Chloroflexi-8]|nr:MAG: D-alanine--D-alanine ligase A [Chloroflexi bacterium HGW-Chloroflexi-8]
MKKLTVAILFGGRSGEHEISLLSARSVLNMIDRSLFDVVEVGITRAGTWMVGNDVINSFEKGELNHLQRAFFLPESGNHTIYTETIHNGSTILAPYKTIDVVFPVLHGSFGEDGTIQGLLDLIEIAYVGAGVLGSSVGMDKAVFKQIMRGIKINVLDDIVFSRKEILSNLDEVINRCEKLGPYPFFTKPANLGSSVGISKCRDRKALINGLKEAANYDRRILVEIGLNKPMEIEVSVLGNEFPAASIAGEIVPGDEFYTYEDKYFNGVSILIIPAELPTGMMDKIRDIAVRAFMAIDCSGMARVDFLVDQNTEELYLNELNTIPGFTQISMYAKLWEASGIPYTELITRLIDLAKDRHNEKSLSFREYRKKEA